MLAETLLYIWQSRRRSVEGRGKVKHITFENTWRNRESDKILFEHRNMELDETDEKLLTRRNTLSR